MTNIVAVVVDPCESQLLIRTAARRSLGASGCITFPLAHTQPTHARSLTDLDKYREAQKAIGEGWRVRTDNLLAAKEAWAG
jgi:hypothetical protein